MTETQPTTAGQRLRVKGLGLPLIDLIAPSEKELEGGALLIQELQGHIRESDISFTSDDERDAAALAASRGLSNIVQARNALNEFTTFCRDKQFAAGQKPTLAREDTAKVAGWFETMLVAARDINAAAASLGKKEQSLTIRHMGGTMCNKMHTLQSAMGDQIETHMLGALGDEDASGNRARVVKELSDSGVTFSEFPDTSLGLMAVSYILNTPDGNRIAVKAPIENLSTELKNHQKQIADFTQDADIFMIEGSDYGDKKFGAQSFVTAATSALIAATVGNFSPSTDPKAPPNTPKPVIFSPPTDTKLVVGDSDKANACRAAMNLIIDSPSTVLMTMNEEEAVAMFTGKELKKTSLPPEENPQLCEALAQIQERLKAKPRAINHTEPLAFISAGKEGAFYVSTHEIKFVPGVAAGTVVSNIGAGDAFASGVIIEYLNQYKALLAKPDTKFAPKDFSTEALEKITQSGQNLGRACVGFKGAQIPAERVPQIVHGEPPLTGDLTAPIQPPEPGLGFGVAS